MGETLKVMLFVAGVAVFFYIPAMISFSRAVQWSRDVLEEIKRVNQNLDEMKEDLHDAVTELSSVRKELNGTAHRERLSRLGPPAPEAL